MLFGPEESGRIRVLRDERELSFHFLPRSVGPPTCSRPQPTSPGPTKPPAHPFSPRSSGLQLGASRGPQPAPLSGPQFFVLTRSRTRAPSRLDLVPCRLLNLLNRGYFYSLLEGKGESVLFPEPAEAVAVGTACRLWV